MERWLEEFSAFSDADKREIGNNIYRERRGKKWTQSKLAENACISSNTLVSRHENGENITVENIVRYASAFDCSVYNILPSRFSVEHTDQLIPQLSNAMQEVGNLPIQYQNTIFKVIQPLIESFSESI